MAALSDREQKLLEFRRLVARETDWPRVRADIEQAFRDFDTHGLCLSLGDWNKDVHAVSVPMLGADGRKVMAFSASMPARQADRDRLLGEVGPKLVAMRDRVAATLAGRF